MMFDDIEEEALSHAEATYKIIRFKFKAENEVIATGLTLEEVQEHCNRDDTKNEEEGWFDGFTKE